MSSTAEPPCKTRRGERFLDPSTVALHCTDFSFDELVAQHRHILEQARDALRALGMPPRQPAGPAGEGEREGESERPVPGASGPSAPQDPWERHYMVNANQFFPVKNYMLRAFPSLEKRPEDAEAPRVIMECGCGTGSVLLPLMKRFPADIFIGFDISATAVRLLAAHPAATQHHSSGRLAAFAHNIATAALPDGISHGLARPLAPPCVDRLLLVFVLCALQPHEMLEALLRLRAWLRPGSGELLFRDYGTLDHNMLRYRTNGNREMGPRGGGCFVKGDGTTQFFFEREWTLQLFAHAGLRCTAFAYHCNRVQNRKNGKSMDKVFVNATFTRDDGN